MVLNSEAQNHSHNRKDGSAIKPLNLGLTCGKAQITGLNSVLESSLLLKLFYFV